MTQLHELVVFDFDRVATEFDDEKGVMKIVKREVTKRADSIRHRRILKRELKRRAAPSDGSTKSLTRSQSMTSSQSKLQRIQRIQTRRSAPQNSSSSLNLDNHHELMEEIMLTEQYKHVDLNDRQSMAKCVLDKARSLVRRGVIALPTVGWDGQTVEERVALQCIEFIFSAYRVEFYFYELLEMIRKLLMVGCMGMIYHGLPQQFAIGMTITGIFLVFSLRVRPYAHHGLNALNFFSLSFQTILLTAGLLQKIADSTRDSVSEPDRLVTRIVLEMLYVMLVVVPTGILIAENDIRVLDHVKRFFSHCFLPKKLRSRQSESAHQHSAQRAVSGDDQLHAWEPDIEVEVSVEGVEAHSWGVGVGLDLGDGDIFRTNLERCDDSGPQDEKGKDPTCQINSDRPTPRTFPQSGEQVGP